MKLILIFVLVVLAFSGTSSQPTYDFKEVNECGCQHEIEQLQSQIILLKNKVDSIVINDGRTKTGVTSTTAHTETS